MVTSVKSVISKQAALRRLAEQQEEELCPDRGGRAMSCSHVWPLSGEFASVLPTGKVLANWLQEQLQLLR
jgi:hypothetical protein